MSDIWSHFLKLINEQKVQCNKCKTKLAYKDGSTKGMWDHLKRCQKELYAKLKIENAEKKLQPQKQNKQNVLSSTADILQHFTSSSSNIDAADEILMRIIVRQNASFLFADDPDVQLLIKKAFPARKVY